MKKLLLSALLLSSTLGITIGQTESVAPTDKDYKHSLGIGAGFTTGVGLSYRYSIQKFKIQASFAPIKDNYSTNIHAGLSVLFKMVDTEFADFYLYQGNYFLYEKVKDNYPYGYYMYGSDGIRKTWNHGLGIGIEFIILKRVGLNIMGGYAGYDSFREIGLTGETGLYFMF